MKPRKFFGPNSREVLKQVRETLGADALILSNSRAPGGIEVVAVAGAAVNELITAGGRIDPQERPLAWVAPRIDGRVEPKPGTASRAPEQAEAPGMPSVTPSAPRPPVEPGSVESMIAELRAMRGLLEQQLAGLAWNELARRDPGKVAALRLLLAAGFSSGSARSTTDRMPEGMAEEEAPRWLISELNRELETAGAENDIIERGGVYALVGPTGVGKTTTAAKLAARCVVKHGADKLALVTTDTYRIGAHEQLRIYGRILGVPTYSTKDAQELKNVLSELRGRHMVLIDTIGMSQRDRLVAEQASLLRESGSHLRRLLLLNATCNGETLDDVVAAYGIGGVAGCILTKLDEAQSIGPALDCVLRHRLTLHFVTNGQRVPEDLHAPNRSYLIHRALKSSPDGSIHKPVESEYPLMLAAARSIARRNEEARVQPSDQAEGLRRMFAASAVRVLAVIGARHGTGATSATVNLSAALARIGEDVLVLDAQGGSSGVCATLGVEAACDLPTALANDLPIETACVEIDGMRVLAVPRSGAPLAVAEWRTIAALTAFAGRRDFVVVDAGDASRELQHLPFANGRGEALVVLNRAASAITEGYAQVKRLVRERRMRRFMVLVNRVADEAQARAIHANMARVAAGHLDARLEYLGYIPVDERLGAPRRRAGSTVTSSPDCPAAQAFRRIAVALASEREEDISPRQVKGVEERTAGMRLRSINH